MLKAFYSICEFVKKQLNDKNYKVLILALIIVLLGVIYLSVARLTKIDSKLDSLAKNDSAIESNLHKHINNLYATGIGIFEAYAESSTTDLQTIVDYSVSSKKEAALLRALLQKSLTESSKDAKKQQFKSKMIDTTKWELSGKKLSFTYTGDSSKITQAFYGNR